MIKILIGICLHKFLFRGKPDKYTPESMAPFLEITKSRRQSLSTSALHQVIIDTKGHLEVNLGSILNYMVYLRL